MNSSQLLTAILTFVNKHKYPDIHLNSGFTPYVRKHNGDLENISTISIDNKEIQLQTLTSQLIKECVSYMCGENTVKKLEATQELDSSYVSPTKERYRINCYIDAQGYNIAMRLISSRIPSLDELEFGETVKKMCHAPKGLILITGPTGSGKSTNMAGMIDYINKNFKKHIITIEDPIEFTFTSELSLINQREIGKHTRGFASAMKATLREDPDVIVIGEMRDPQTIKTAITLAETGHLVISTLHTNDTVQTLDRIIDIFPSTQQRQIRMQLALSLVGVISQRLIPTRDMTGRIATREVLLNNNAIRNLLIEGKTHQIYGVLEIAAKEGMILMDKSLVYLFNKGLISKESLMIYARDKETIEMMII